MTTGQQAALAIVGVAVVGSALAVGLATAPGEASAAMQGSGFSVEDVSVETSEIDRIDILGGSARAEWSDLPSEPSGAEVVYEVENPDGSMQDVGGPACATIEEQYDCWYDGNASSGEVYWSAAPVEIDLFGDTGWTAEDFEPAPGEQVSHTITVTVTVTVPYDGGEVTVTDSDTTTIAVTNPAAATETETNTAGGGGGGGEGNEEEHDPSLAFSEHDSMSVLVATPDG